MTREEHDHAETTRNDTHLSNVPTIEEFADVSGRDEDELRKAANAVGNALRPATDDDSDNEPQSRTDEGTEPQ